MRWLYAVLVLIFAYIFMTIQPLDNIPSAIYSYIWLFVVILGTINFLLGSNIYYALRGGVKLISNRLSCRCDNWICSVVRI